MTQQRAPVIRFPLVNRIAEVDRPLHVRFFSRRIEGLARDEVLVRVRASAICGSDLHIARGKHPSAPLPVTIGHEFSGDVAAVGSGVTKFVPGERVTVEPCIVCGSCEACRQGNYGYCENISYTYRNGDGSMADYVIVKESCVYSLPDYLSYETGALMEPLSVATHAVRRAGIGLGDHVLIIGDGAIGLLIAAMCRRSGASRIIVGGHSEKRLSVALGLGATDIVNTHTDSLEEAVRQLTDGRGVEKSFECVGRESCFHQALNTLRHNGLATVVGIYEDQDLNFAPARLITHELRLQGTQGYCWDFPVAIEAAKELPLSSLITHRFPMSALQTALDTALDRRNESIKVLLLSEAAAETDGP